MHSKNLSASPFLEKGNFSGAGLYRWSLSLRITLNLDALVMVTSVLQLREELEDSGISWRVGGMECRVEVIR